MELDFGALGSSPVARGLSAPLNIPYSVAFVLDVAGDNEALVARNGTGINSIPELKGNGIGTPFASTAHYRLLAALAQNGLTPNDVQLIDLQPQAILAAWDRGDIDAAYTWLPTVDDLRKTGKDLITSRQLAKDGKPTLDLAAVSNSFAEAHPDVVTTWRQQQARALSTIHDDPDAAAKAIAGAGLGFAPTPGLSAGVVFQQPRLFPWRTVGGNVDLALKYAKVPRDLRPERRAAILHRVGLEGTANRKIWEISGDQQQRVAIARALAAETPTFLLDEPFAALDALTRERLQEDVRQVSAERSGRTTVFVTRSAKRPPSWGRGSWC